MDIKGKVAIVTGASSGIGHETAKLLTREGAKVAVVARSKDKLTELSNELTDSFTRPTDMTKLDQVQEMIGDVHRHYGQIDVLINNAGQGYDASIEQTDIETLRHVFDLDLVGPLFAMQQVIPIMKARGGGSIINISSGTALMNLPNMGGYAAIKAALAHLSMTAREELKEYGIIVSVVYPYITNTDFEKNTIKAQLKKTGPEYGGYYVPPKADTPEFIAKKIVESIKSGDKEIFAHRWMKQPYNG